MKKIFLVLFLSLVTFSSSEAQVFPENCKFLPGFEELFASKTKCQKPGDPSFSRVDIVNGMSPVSDVKCFTYECLMGQILFLLDSSSVELSETQVNYFFVNNKRGDYLVVKVYKRIDLADGIWYLDAKPASSVTYITNGRIFEPL